jgi:hypothetical protein
MASGGYKWLTKPEILQIYRNITRVARKLQQGDTLYIRDFSFQGNTPDVYYSLRGACLRQLHYAAPGLCLLPHTAQWRALVASAPST